MVRQWWSLDQRKCLTKWHFREVCFLAWGSCVFYALNGDALTLELNWVMWIWLRLRYDLMHLLSPNWLFACPMMLFALPLAWGWLPPYICHTNVICVETRWRIWTPRPQLQVQPRKGLMPPDAEQHDLTLTLANISRTLEPSSFYRNWRKVPWWGWPWFPGQMGVSWCGMPPVWTFFTTPSIKHLPKKRVE